MGQVQSEFRERLTFGKKPSETVVGFQLLTSLLRRTCEQMPCQDGDTAFLYWENSFLVPRFYGGGQDYNVHWVLRALHDPVSSSHCVLRIICIGTGHQLTVPWRQTLAVIPTFSGQLTFHFVLTRAYSPPLNMGG